jgi:general secretion pathway protein C
MSLGKKVFAAPARLWMNWPLWGGLLATLLLAKHVWVLFAPAEHAVPGTASATQSAQTEQLFGTVSTATASASLSSIRPIGIFASKKDGFAVMMTETGQVGVGLGGQVAPGVRLIETHADYVILDRNGVQQRVDLSKAPAATGGISPAAAPVRAAPPVRGMTVPPAGGQLLDQLTPEQQTILHQQQQDLKRGRH